VTLAAGARIGPYEVVAPHAGGKEIVFVPTAASRQLAVIPY